MSFQYLSTAHENLNDAQRAVIRETLEGHSIAEVCRLAGVPKDTYYDWSRHHSAFRICLLHILSLGIEHRAIGGHKPEEWPTHAQGKLPEMIPLSWYRPQDYARLRKLMADGHLLPEDYDTWRATAEETLWGYRRIGFPIVKVYIDPYLFVSFCELHSIPLDSAARLVYASGWLTRRSNPHLISDFGEAFDSIGHQLMWAHCQHRGLPRDFRSVLSRTTAAQQQVLMEIGAGEGDLEAALAAAGVPRDTYQLEWCMNEAFITLLYHSMSLREERNLVTGPVLPFYYEDREAPQTMTLSWYRPQDYGRLRALSLDGPQLPADYETWLVQAEAVYDSYRDAAFPVEKVIIDPLVYPNWCQRQGYPLNAVSRVLYAADSVTSSGPPNRRN